MDGVRVRIDGELGGLELVEAVHARPHFARHSHATYALGIMVRGANRFRYRGAYHTAYAGEVCTVTPDEPHSVEPVGERGFAYRCLYPPPERVRSAAEALRGGAVRETVVFPPVIADAATARLVAAVFDADAAGLPALAREEGLAALLERVVTRHATVQVRTSAPPRTAGVARAREHLSDRIAENVPLSRLAAEAGLEPFALLRAFSGAYGLPPHAWQVQERVRRAKGLLARRVAPAEVAAALGFSDQSHLTRAFRRIVGVTPGRYQREVAPTVRPPGSR